MVLWKLDRAHPRVGGENAEPDGLVDPEAGSSPRGRGKRTVSVWLPYGPRLIPAWAGKTPPPAPRGASAWAHPRVGGENCLDCRVGSLVVGSSPRGRGKHTGLAVENPEDGLIPAWAGKTASPPSPAP